jgi:hypothetical protein
MFDHVKFGVSDFAASKAFYLQALAPLGVAVVSEGTPHMAWSSARRRARLRCACSRPRRRRRGKDHGAPGLRPHYHANCYAAFVIGPDGHNIEVVCHAPQG